MVDQHGAYEDTFIIHVYLPHIIYSYLNIGNFDFEKSILKLDCISILNNDLYFQRNEKIILTFIICYFFI